MSGRLFCAAFDPYLRWLVTALAPKSGMARACADDVGAPLRKARHLARMVPVFESAKTGAGLEIRPDTCAVVPVAGRGADVDERVREKVAVAVPAWAAFKVGDHATYLGYVLGPGAGPRRWAKPLAKWAERVAEIARSAPPVSVARQQYVVKALPVFDYVVAMSAPPSDIRER